MLNLLFHYTIIADGFEQQKEKVHRDFSVIAVDILE